VALENGQKTSPPASRFQLGGDKVVPVNEIVIDNSTSPKTVTDRSVAVNADDVTVTIAIRDKTADELDSEATVSAALKATGVYGLRHKLQLAGTFYCVNEIRALNSQTLLTVDAFLSALASFAAQMPDAKFRNKIKALV